MSKTSKCGNRAGSLCDPNTRSALALFLGLFIKWRKATSSSAVCVSVHMEKLGFHLMDFHKTLYLSKLNSSKLSLNINILPLPGNVSTLLGHTMAFLTLRQLHTNCIIIPMLQDSGKLNNKTEAQEAEYLHHSTYFHHQHTYCFKPFRLLTHIA